MDQLVLEGGFEESVFGAQTVFRALMDAFANPGRAQALQAPLAGPPELSAGLAALILTLCDHDPPLWLDPALRASEALATWIRFHTGAPLIADPSRAHFAFATAAERLPPLAHFAAGTDDYPDRSTTIALAVPALDGGPVLTLRGPGIDGVASIAPVGLPDDFITQWVDNGALFPRGIDLLLVAGDRVMGLPRSTRISAETA